MRSNEKRFEAIYKRLDDLKEYVDMRFEAGDKRLDDLKYYVDKRFESLERRVELVYYEVSSIKTDIIKMMMEYMERLYGG